MLGRKTREIADLKRALRVRTAERDVAVAGAHADRHAMRTATRLYAEDYRGRRLARALRACARYRRQAAVDRSCFNELAARYWDALGYGPDTLAKLDPSYATEDTP